MKWLLLYALISLLLVVNVSCEYTSWRLPNTTTPIDYNIYVTVFSPSPYQLADTFSGVVNIRINVAEVTENLYLHSKFSNISEILVTDSSHRVIPVEFKTIPARELVHIRSVDGNLIANSEYTIKITYISELRRDKLGFHLSSYVNSGGQNVYVMKFYCILDTLLSSISGT